MTPLEMTRLLLEEALHVENDESEFESFYFWAMDGIAHYTITLKDGQQFHGILYGMPSKEVEGAKV